MNTNNNSDVDLISVPPTNLLIAALGNAHAAIVLQHLLWCYLHFGKKEFYRTRAAMSFGDDTDGHIGTGLSVDKIRTAIKWLKKNRLIATKNKLTHHKPPPKLHFTLNFYEINQLFIERGYKSLISPYWVTLPNSIGEMSPNKSKNITALEDELPTPDTSLSRNKKTSFSCADAIATPQPSESADMRKKSNPDPTLDLADVLAEKPKPVKRRVSVRQHEARAAYAQARQPDERFSADVAAKWEHILPNIESIKNHRAGIYTLEAWKQTVVEYQTAHGSANTVLWLQRLVEKGADWIYKIDVDLLHYQPPPRVRYENNVRSLFPNDPTYPTTHFDPNKIY